MSMVLTPLENYDSQLTNDTKIVKILIHKLLTENLEPQIFFKIKRQKSKVLNSNCKSKIIVCEFN